MHQYETPGGRDLWMEIPRVKNHKFQLYFRLTANPEIRVDHVNDPIFRCITGEFTNGIPAGHVFFAERVGVERWGVQLIGGETDSQYTGISSALVSGVPPTPASDYDIDAGIPSPMSLRDVIYWTGNSQINGYSYETREWMNPRVIRPDDIVYLSFYQILTSNDMDYGEACFAIELTGKLAMMERGTWPYPDPRLEAGPRSAPLLTGGAGPIDPAPVSDPGAVPIGGGVQLAGGHVDAQRDSVDVTRPIG